MSDHLFDTMIIFHTCGEVIIYPTEILLLQTNFVTLIVPCSTYNNDYKFQLTQKGLNCELLKT